jgi:hypothetical protein
MNVKEWLEKVAYVTTIQIIDDEDTKVYKSIFDDSYITHVGMEEAIECLAELEITEELTHGVGYSPKDGKWYGWSHRAIFGFKIGSTCVKGDCHYIGSSEKEQEEDAIQFWSDDYHLDTRCEGIISEDNERFFDIKWKYTNTVPNKKIRDSISGCRHLITPLGKGEWTAKTMADAKQMAVDFNESVS